MSTCTVTGTLADLSLEPLEGVRLTFSAHPPSVDREAGSTLVPDAISTTSGAGGAVSAVLVPGAYRLRVYGQTATYVADVTVPEASAAYLHQILDLPPPENLDAAEQAVIDAQTARDTANTHAITAQTAASNASTSEANAAASEGAASTSASNAASSAPAESRCFS